MTGGNPRTGVRPRAACAPLPGPRVRCAPLPGSRVRCGPLAGLIACRGAVP
ncbi:MAG TPA: hypothetical protein VIY52_02025 [Streptosporangiaceae bacterium]